jgi:hypothetical protein
MLVETRVVLVQKPPALTKVGPLSTNAVLQTLKAKRWAHHYFEGTHSQHLLKVKRDQHS